MMFDDYAPNLSLLTAIRDALPEADRGDPVSAIQRLHREAASAADYGTTLRRLQTMITPLYYTITQAVQDFDKATMDALQIAANSRMNIPSTENLPPPSTTLFDPPTKPTAVSLGGRSIAEARALTIAATETTPAELHHATREPNAPCEATILERDSLAVKLVRRGSGDVVFQLIIDGQVCGLVPFDNLVKAATRIDPDHAVGPEKQIQELRRALSEARGELHAARITAGQGLQT